MAGIDASACRANSSASRTLSPVLMRMGVVPGAVSASAIRAIDEPITLAIWTAESRSTMPSATSDWNSWTASMSMSVNAGSSSSTSRNPSARQKRLATSTGMSVRTATSDWVRRCPVGTSRWSTTSRSSTSSSTARSISSSLQPSSRRR